jgi:glycosyltransferase involved in cell wall biosynthesis
MRLLLPAVARRASAVIVPSFVARRDLLETLDLAPERVHVVHEAAPEWFCQITDEAQLNALRRKYNLPEEFILFLGTLEPRKNLERLIQAVARLHQRGRPIALVLVGQQGWHMEGHRGRPGLHELVSLLDMEAHVRHLGYVPTADLPGLLSLSTVFAFPSLYEGFGLPALEAMACGAPVLTSRNTAMAEVCADAAHFVDPYNIEDIANSLEVLLTDDAYRHELSQRALCQAKRYSWKQAAEETIAVYNKVLATTDHG